MCDCPTDVHLDGCVVTQVRAERAAQGLPPTVEDSATLARVASIVAGTRERREGVPA